MPNAGKSRVVPEGSAANADVETHTIAARAKINRMETPGKMSIPIRIGKPRTWNNPRPVSPGRARRVKFLWAVDWGNP